MRTSLLKLLWIVVALTLSATASAIGLGGIGVNSALGQRLDASIELVAVSNAEKTSLVARLAAPDVYKGAGIEYPYGNKFTFAVESRANGEPYLKVSSAQPVNDPFVSLLVELTWSSGKLLREYTFLLDPPGYVAEQPKEAVVQAVAPVAQAMPTEAEEAMPVEQQAPVSESPAESQSAAVQSETPAPVEVPAAKPEEAPVAAKPVKAAPAKLVPAEPAAAKMAAAGTIAVQRGDTLSKIAAQYKPAEVSLERMLVALYRANADQFDGKNMNRIRTGKILRLPEQSELTSVAQPEAAKEVRAQTEDWNAYRQKLAGAATAASQPQEAKQVASGKITSSVVDKAPVAKESAKEVLKLSKGGAPGDKAAAGIGGKPMSAQDKKNVAQEEAIAKAKAAKDEQARAALLQKNLDDMKRLAQLKSEALAKASKEPVVESKELAPAMSPAPAASNVAATSEVAAASGVEAAKPKAAAKPKPKVVVAEPSLVDQIMEEPLYLAGAAAVLLGLGGLGFMLSRRKKSSVVKLAEPVEDVGTATGQLTAPVAPSPDTGDFTVMAENHAETEAQQSDDVDPISEADLFLNFGRDAQAEEILKEALRNTPDNHQIHLKLLGIYVNRKDVNSFSGIARQLQDSGDDEAWQQAAAMGRRLEPNNPMYGSAGMIEDADSATMQTPAIDAMPETAVPDVDFDLGETPVQASPEQMRGSEQTMILSPEDMAAAQVDAMDFDITSTIPPASAPAMDFESISAPAPAEPAEAALPNLDDLIFDVTSPSVPETQPEEIKPAAVAPEEDGGMEFTLDFPVEDTVKEPAPAAHSADIGLAGITLNLDEDMVPAEPAMESAPTEVRDEHWHEVATKLDLAKAYQEMGDATGAREILEEVLNEGDAGQREAAQAMIDQLG